MKSDCPKGLLQTSLCPAKRVQLSMAEYWTLESLGTANIPGFGEAEKREKGNSHF